MVHFNVFNKIQSVTTYPLSSSAGHLRLYIKLLSGASVRKLMVEKKIDKYWLKISWISQASFRGWSLYLSITGSRFKKCKNTGEQYEKFWNFLWQSTPAFPITVLVSLSLYCDKWLSFWHIYLNNIIKILH